MYNGFASDARTIPDEDAWNLQINPLGLADALRTDWDDSDRPAMPAVTLSWRW
jgi:hypothetical protein